jgi:hypothetical protein
VILLPKVSATTALGNARSEGKHTAQIDTLGACKCGLYRSKPRQILGELINGNGD